MVTIIITNFNKGPYISEAIDSALNQNFSDYEILIIDDGSTDESSTIIKDYAQKNSLIRTIFQENSGVVKTRNRAIREAKDGFIVQLDGDDKLHENFLKWTVPELKRNEDVGIVFCKTELFGARDGIWNRGKYSIKSQLTANLIVITALFRKSDFLKTKGYNLEFSKGLEDWDFWLSIIELGRDVVEVDQIGFYYRILPESRNSSYSIETENELKKRIFDNHTSLYLTNELNPVKLLWDIRILELEISDLSLKVASFENKLGSFILKPYRFFQKIFRR